KDRSESWERSLDGKVRDFSIFDGQAKLELDRTSGEVPTGLHADRVRTRMAFDRQDFIGWLVFLGGVGDPGLNGVTTAVILLFIVDPRVGGDGVCGRRDAARVGRREVGEDLIRQARRALRPGGNWLDRHAIIVSCSLQNGKNAQKSK